MQRFLLGLLIMRTTQRLAVYRDDPFDRLAYPLDPWHKTGFKLLRIDESEHPPKGIVRRYPTGQVEQIRKKGLFCFPEFFDLNPSACSAKYSTNPHNNDIPQSVQLGSFHARVFHFRNQAFQISYVLLFHLM